jgi:hypothetical protein
VLRALRYVAAMQPYFHLPFAVCIRQLLLWQCNFNPSWPSALQPTYSICHKWCLCVCQNTLWVSTLEVTVTVTLCSIPDPSAVQLHPIHWHFVPRGHKFTYKHTQQRILSGGQNKLDQLLEGYAMCCFYGRSEHFVCADELWTLVHNLIKKLLLSTTGT